MKQFNKILNIFIIGCVAALAVACSDDDDKSDGTQTDPGNPVTSISLANVTDNVIVLEEIGAAKSVEITTAPANADDTDAYYYEYISDNQNVFTVDNSGKITATGWGDATLTVTAKNNAPVSTKCRVVVLGNTPVESIVIDEDYKTIELLLTSGTPQYDLASRVTVYPADASVKTVKYTTSDDQVAGVNGDGTIFIKGYGIATIRVEAIDGSGVYAESTIKVSVYEYRLLDRTNWKAVDSSPYIEVTKDEFVGGGPSYAIDDKDNNTCLTLLKAAAEGGPADGILYFTVDMGEQQTFNYYTISGTWAGDVNNDVKINRLSIYGSNDGNSFTPLQEDITVSTGVYDNEKLLDETHTYRYFKIAVTPSRPAITGSTYTLIKNFELTNRVLLIP